MTFNVKSTTDLSIIVQIITGVVGLGGLFIAVAPQHQIIKDILKVELGVQIVELAFYIYFLRRLAGTNVAGMAAFRYFDWFITTPIMLFTTIVYFEYEQQQTEENPQPIDLGQFVSENSKNIGLIGLFNLLMLLFGYFGETGCGDRWLMGGFGFLAFFGAFYLIYTEYAVKTKIGQNMFAILFGVWTMYGVAYSFDDDAKNITFNGLDVVAKNFFGLFLASKIHAARLQ
jgi:hypothetical protein